MPIRPCTLFQRTNDEPPVILRTGGFVLWLFF
jgi:hypothetical protein